MFLLHNVGVANMILLAFLLLAIQPAVPHRTVEMTPVAAMARGEKVAAQMSRILVYYAPI